MQSCVQVDKGQVLTLRRGEDFCGRTHIGHPIQLFVRASSGQEARMNIRYRVELSQSERDELKGLLSGGKNAARKLKRAQILPAADAGTDCGRLGPEYDVCCGKATDAAERALSLPTAAARAAGKVSNTASRSAPARKAR